MTGERPPRILQISRDFVTRGSEVGTDGCAWKDCRAQSGHGRRPGRCHRGLPRRAEPRAVEGGRGALLRRNDRRASIWGMPARAWIAADPQFWKPNPMAGPSR